MNATVYDFRTTSTVGLAIFCLLVACWGLLAPSAVQAQQDFYRAPIHYETAKVDDAVSRLKQKLADGSVNLKWHDRKGWLPSLLQHLSISETSQCLVFSKTSLQINRISPGNPRAIYFNDDTYLGYVPQGDIIEISAVDPQLGAIFYSIDQKESSRPDIRRDQTQCMTCHATSRTEDVPGYLVRSVYAGASGHPHYGLGTITTNHSTQLKDRFGGWYVTGLHGQMRHRGNVMAKNDPRKPLDPEDGANQRQLPERIGVDRYMTDTSDLVALMLLEHQSQMHNLITKAAYETRQAEHYQSEMNRLFERPADFQGDSTRRRIAAAGERLLEYLLFCDEYRLTGPVQGTSAFAARFSEQGPVDDRGRSLRDWDLQGRLFRYPCSFLIYSESYESLPKTVLDYIETRLVEVLLGQDNSGKFDHLSADDRRAILEILVSTKPRFANRIAATPSFSR